MEFLGLDLQETLKHIGHIGILAIIFAECGILAGFFLPGDSLLFTAGLLASTGYLNLWIILIGGSLAAVAGDSFGYYLGHKFGPRVFNKESSLLFHKGHVERARNYYAKYGPLTIFIARFMPIIRTFAPVMAGVGRMNYPTFLFFNVSGGLFWVFSMTLLGYFLGELIDNIDRYVLPIVITIIVLSVVPGLIVYLRNRRKPGSA